MSDKLNQWLSIVTFACRSTGSQTNGTVMHALLEENQFGEGAFMNIYVKMAFPALCIALAIFYTAKRKNDKNYMFPAFLMLAISLVCALIGLKI